MAKERHRKKEKRKDGKHKRKKRRRSSSRSSGGGSGGRAPSPRRLLLAAALGDKQQCRELVQDGADVAYADAEGTTALHEACRHGHLSTAKLLLRRGADAGLGDVRGDTPAHLAARHGHLDVLAALLQADNPPEIEATNARGQSVAQLAAKAMDKQDVQSYRREAEEQEWGRQGERQRERSPSLQPDEWDWQQRLQNEMSMGQSEDDPWGAYSGGDWHADEYETPEEYAKRIWEEMQAHRRSKENAERAAFTQRRRQEEAQRQAFREHAEAESRRILEEQKQQDADWRAAVAEGQAGTKRARAEAAWQFFASKHPGELLQSCYELNEWAWLFGSAERTIHRYGIYSKSTIRYADVPWILAAEEPKQEELQRVVLYGTGGPEEQRRRLRTELVRWHPDKFVARFGRRLAAEDRDRILARVARTAQQLNAISSALK